MVSGYNAKKARDIFESDYFQINPWFGVLII